MRPRNRAALAAAAVILMGSSSAVGRGRGAPHQVRTALPPRQDVEGTWSGTLTVGGWVRSVGLELRERPGGGLLAYAFGLTARGLVVNGRREGWFVILSLKIDDPSGPRSLSVRTRLVGDRLVGTVVSDGVTGAADFHRVAEQLEERRFAVVVLEGGEAIAIDRVAVVHTASGGFVGGAFVGESNCDLWACEGRVTSFTETATTLTVGLADDGGCSTGSSVSLDFDAGGKVYSGTYTYTTCGGSATGSVVAGRIARARSEDVSGILETMATLARDIEAPAPLTAPNAAFSATYLDYGRTQQDVIDGFNDEKARHEQISVAYSSLHDAHTVDDPYLHPALALPTGIEFDLSLTGIPVGGGNRGAISDPFVGPSALNRLRRWTEAGGAWVVDGSHAAALDLPFAYTVDGTSLAVPTAGGTVHVSLGSYGGHFGPLTGHAYGDAKANLVGFLSRDDGDLTELVGDGDGIREPGEIWGFYGGPTGDLIRGRIPTYRAPFAGEVTGVIYESGPTGDYFDDVPHWSVEIARSAELSMRLGHLGGLAPGLAAAVLSATGIDPATYSGPTGDILGGERIPVAAGEAIAYPQVLATPVSGFPGYYGGGGSFLERPWAQMEFFVTGPAGSERADVCAFELMTKATSASLQGVLDADMADPHSQRYGAPGLRQWEWAAEGRVCMAYSPVPRDFSALYTNLGGWFEIDGPTTTFDELISFAPIATDAASYDASQYDSAQVRMLILRRRSIGLKYTWTMPDASSLDVFYPSGEVLEATSDTLLIKWRDIGYGPGGSSPVYQRAAFLLDGNGLKVAWGALAATPGAAVRPPLGAATPCNDTDVLCYDHTFHHDI